MAKPTNKLGHDAAELGFLSHGKAAVLEDSPVWANSILYGALIMIVVGVIWAHFSEVDEVSRAAGQIIPSSKVQLIQSLEGGILRSLLVKEGQLVEAGEELLRIDDTRFSSSLEENLAHRSALRASTARLAAESKNAKVIQFPKDLQKERPDLVRHETELFESKRKLLNQSVASIQQDLDLAKRERELIQPAIDKRLVVEREQIKLDRDIVEMQGKVSSLRNQYQSEAFGDLAKQQGELAQLDEALRADQDRVERTSIKSPMRGLVKNIRVTTMGGVIGPGEPIMEIVPLEEHLLVEAKLQPKDIAFVHPGQKAMVKLTAYDYGIYGGLPGVVENVSADTLIDKNDREARPYYQIYVRTDKSFLGDAAKPLPVIPGMTTSVDILTGHKTVLSYLLKPLQRAKSESLRER